MGSGVDSSLSASRSASKRPCMSILPARWRRSASSALSLAICTQLRGAPRGPTARAIFLPAFSVKARSSNARRDGAAGQIILRQKRREDLRRRGLRAHAREKRLAAEVLPAANPGDDDAGGLRRGGHGQHVGVPAGAADVLLYLDALEHADAVAQERGGFVVLPVGGLFHLLDA